MTIFVTCQLRVTAIKGCLCKFILFSFGRALSSKPYKELEHGIRPTVVFLTVFKCRNIFSTGAGSAWWWPGGKAKQSCTSCHSLRFERFLKSFFYTFFWNVWCFVGKQGVAKPCTCFSSF